MTHSHDLPTKKKSGFTLIEMVIVVSIVSILLILVRSSFQSPNIYKSESYNCVQYAHSFMQSFVYAGLTQKGLSDNGSLIFPQEYNITVNPTQQIIQLGYDNNTYDIFSLSGSIQQGCRSSNYQVRMTGASYTIYISNNTMSSSSFTGHSNFLFCPNGEDCQSLGAIGFDTRTQQLQKHQCSSIPDQFCP